MHSLSTTWQGGQRRLLALLSVGLLCAATAVLCGRAGGDSLRGHDGSDILRGNRGGDNLLAGRGSDRLFGGSGADTLESDDGIGGNDRVDGGPGHDICLIDIGDVTRGCEEIRGV